LHLQLDVVLRAAATRDHRVGRDARCASMATYVDATLGPTLLRIASPAAEPPRPVFAESFTVSTVELDDTLNGTVSVRQVLRRDSTARRSWMLANGTLVSGGLEEIMRCDIHPLGWFTTSGGSDATDPTSWACQNMSINSDPTSCQWNLFWEPLPANATYVGRESMDGRNCDRWTYWKWGEEYSLWASADTPNTPVATGKISTFGGDHKWRILWRNFTAGAPPLSAFEPTPGIKCPPAPPPPAEAPAAPVVCSSLARFTPLSPRVIRLEYRPSAVLPWVDQASVAFAHRGDAASGVTVTVHNATEWCNLTVSSLDAPTLRLSFHKPGASAAATATDYFTAHSLAVESDKWPGRVERHLLSNICVIHLPTTCTEPTPICAA
jgi:hypothetical protein